MLYAELHAKTNFSFLEGASHPDELVHRAAELGYAALAVTDRNSLAGVVRAHGTAKELGLKLLVGAEITPEDAPPVVLWATDRAAYERLARLITQGRRRAEKGECRLSLTDVAEHAEGLLAGVVSSQWSVVSGQKEEDCKLQIDNSRKVRETHRDNGQGSVASGQKEEDFKSQISNLKSHIGNPLNKPTDSKPQILNPEPRTLNPPPSPLPLPPSLYFYRDLFADRCYLLAELHYGPDDQRQLEQLMDLSRRARVPLVAAGDVHYHAHERQALGDVLTAIRHGCTVFTAGELLFPNAQRYLKSPEEMAQRFARCPEAVCRTLEIADRCTFSLDQLRYEYPEELAPPGQTPSVYLARLTWAGARRRYPRGVPDKVRQLVEHELRLIEELHYEAYFLTVWDLVRFARVRRILCQGRGSAANSAVCYCLGITSVDPERMDVLFERFVSRERNEAPDIDIDFEHERREEVLQYLYNKYGRERAGMTAEVITYRPRSAVRDVGKALGLSLEQVDRLAKRLEHRHEERGQGSEVRVQDSEDCRVRETHRDSGQGSGVSGQKEEDCKLGTTTDVVPDCKLQIANAPSETINPGLQVLNPEPGTLNPLHSPHPTDHRPLTTDHSPHPTSHTPLPTALCREVGIDPGTPLGRQFVELVGQLVGFPRHLSQHTGGMVMTRGPLCELVPIENAAMPDRTVIQWNKDDLDELGILKVDCLALGMLTAIRKCFALVRRHYGKRPTLANIPEGDEDVYAMIRRADTMGVFQIESRAQMSMLPRLRPKCFYDLVIEVAIVRPGPIQGNMVHPYLRRRSGEEPVTYPNEVVRQVLEKTLGVPLFQEQAMRLAVEAAGFTPGEADQLRRAMGAWRRPGLIDQFRKKLIDGMLGRQFSQEYAEAVFTQIRGFGDYGFPESHAASFALLVYVSAWLKYHYPAAFTAALLNSQPMGFYAPAQLVRNAREHGVEVLPVDVNCSEWDCTLERVQGSGFEVQDSEDRRVRETHRDSGQWSVVSGQKEEDCKLQIVNCKLQIDGTQNEPTDSKLQILNPEPRTPNSPYSPHPTPHSPPPTTHYPLPTSPFALRLGFRMLHGMPRAQAEQIVQARGDRPFRSLEDFARRTGLSRAAMMRLAKAGTFGSLGCNRREALWNALGQDQKELPLFDNTPPLPPGEGRGEGNSNVPLFCAPVRCTHPTLPTPHSPHTTPHYSLPTPHCPLPSMSPAEEVVADYRATGLSLKAHPMQFLRADLDRMGVVSAAGLKTWPNGKPVRVAGLVLVRQRPGTAKGITFVTLEDETGTANLIIRQGVWTRYRAAALGATVLLAQGPLQRQGEVIHVLTTRLEDLSAKMRGMGPQSRDFH